MLYKGLGEDATLDPVPPYKSQLVVPNCLTVLVKYTLPTVSKLFFAVESIIWAFVEFNNNLVFVTSVRGAVGKVKVDAFEYTLLPFTILKSLKKAPM